jgi:hypothetical protein
VATVIENAYRDRAGETFGMLAHHYAEAGEHARAASYMLDAAKAALAVFANDEAARFAEQGIALAGSDEQLIIALLEVKESADSLRGDRDSQRDDLDQLEQHAQLVHDQDVLCEMLFRRISLMRSLGERAAEEDLTETLLGEANASNSLKWMARALEARAARELLLSHFARAHTAAEEALHAYGHMSDEAGRFEMQVFARRSERNSRNRGRDG